MLLIPLFNPITVYLFGINKTLSGADLKDVGFGDELSIEKSPIANIPYQALIVKPGKYK